MPAVMAAMCVQRAKDKQYQALQQQRKAERVAEMPPERRAEYEKNRQAGQRGAERPQERQEIIKRLVATGEHGVPA